MNAPSRKPTIDLDAYYRSRPKPPELYLWPVTDDPFTMKPIRWFDSWSEAVDFVSANLGRVNLYVGEPKRKRDPLLNRRDAA